MKDDIVENSDIIKNANRSLQARIMESNLPGNEKKALEVLLEKLNIYYDKKMNLISKKSSNSAKQKETNSLICFMTDILVEVNSVLIGNNDIYYFVSLVNKKLHDKDIEKLIINNKKK